LYSLSEIFIEKANINTLGLLFISCVIVGGTNVTKRAMNVAIICLILFSLITVRGQFVEEKEIQRENNNQSVSLSEQEIAEEVSKKFRSSFVENKGQLGNEEIVFYGSLPNGKIAFGVSKVLLWMEGMNSIVTLNFLGARKVSPTSIDEPVTKSNYFLGNRGTYTNVRSFGAIIYSDLWEGIDLFYQATPKGAKYEFRVAPGANPEDIRIKCEGQEQLIIGKDSLAILKGKGRFVDEGLEVFQEGIEIAAKFIAKGSNSFGFQLSEYDKTKSLVIDPLIYSTFVGGSNSECGTSIALDSEGNAYVTGYTSSSDFPTTESAYNRTHGGGSDCFVFKLSADGSALLYSTFIGGNEGDYGHSITLDNEKNAYVTGSTKSIDFPTTSNAYNRIYGGVYSDCFVFKLSADGSSLLHSTYVGGSDMDQGKSIAIDNEGIAYVTGYTKSIDFPTTDNAYDKKKSGAYDCIIIKLSADGSSLLYSTFIGGKVNEFGGSIVLDTEGNVYISGETSSGNFPTTANAFDKSYNGGDSDCFISKLSEDGSTILYSTFIGGSDYDYGYSIALDNDGNAYVTGYTKSIDFPTSENAYNRTHCGVRDCFIFKLLIEDTTRGIGIPIFKTISLSFTSLVSIVMMTVIVQRRRKRK